MVRNISGVILAGGAGKRFDGIIKSKIVINGKTIISRIIETIGDIFDEIIIVTNTPEEFTEYNEYKIIGDKILNRGPLGGIHSAMKATDSEALFVFAGDMPLLEKGLIIRQIGFFNDNICGACIPRINQDTEPLHGIYRNTLLPVLEEYLEEENNYAIREFFKKADVHYLQFEVTEKDRMAFTNINSPADVIAVKNYLGTGQ